MTDQVSPNSLNYVELAADIVSAYVTKNALPVSELPALIASVHSALQGTNNPAPAAPEKATPAISVKKSVTPDALYSLEDGKPYKSLKRHLTKLGMTPAEYKAKWGLPKDYPMVAASYAAKRSELAKNSGLGQKRKGAGAAKGGRKKVA